MIQKPPNASLLPQATTVASALMRAKMATDNNPTRCAFAENPRRRPGPALADKRLPEDEAAERRGEPPGDRFTPASIELYFADGAAIDRKTSRAPPRWGLAL